MSSIGCLVLVLFAVFLLFALKIHDKHIENVNDANSLFFEIVYLWEHTSGGRILAGDHLRVEFREGVVTSSSDYNFKIHKAMDYCLQLAYCEGLSTPTEDSSSKEHSVKCSKKAFKLLQKKFGRCEEYQVTPLSDVAFEVHLKELPISK